MLNSHINNPLKGLVLASSFIAQSAFSYNIYKTDDSELNLNVTSFLGAFHSEEGYLGTAGKSSTWQELSLKVGVTGETKINNTLTTYGGLSAIHTANWGDGDANGFTNGTEKVTKIEDAYVGVRSSLLDFSFGRQPYSIGDGFLINGDGATFGEGLNDQIPSLPDYSRAGAFMVSNYNAFDQTAILRVTPNESLKGELFWLKSDNPVSASMELAGLNIEKSSEMGTVGLTYIKGLDIDEDQAPFLGRGHRDGQETFSLRYQGNMGVEPLFLSAEYAIQNQGNEMRPDADGYYVELGWTFFENPLAPSVNFRYSSYDVGFDSLFYGYSRGYGTWYQGEVAANFGIPENTGVDISLLALKAYPLQNVAVGANVFSFDNTNGTGSNDAKELDLFAEWYVNEHLVLTPVIGFYKPESSTSSQGNNNTNTYVQLLAIVNF